MPKPRGRESVPQYKKKIYEQTSSEEQFPICDLLTTEENSVSIWSLNAASLENSRCRENYLEFILHTLMQALASALTAVT
jgi:hypothetical protein